MYSIEFEHQTLFLFIFPQAIFYILNILDILSQTIVILEQEDTLDKPALFNEVTTEIQH